MSFGGAPDDAAYEREEREGMRDDSSEGLPLDDEGPALTAIDTKWTPVTFEKLVTPPAPRLWLLRHPTKDDQPCAPGMGDGMFPRGKVGVLSSAGGVGKTQVLVGLAVSVATGRPWLDHFHLDHEGRKGRVLVAVAEEDAEEWDRRLFNAARGLSDDEKRRVADRVVALPLAGCPVALLAQNGRHVADSAVLVALRRKLEAETGPDGWALVALDPLARWAGPEVESDSATATRFVQALETLTASPGRPSVLMAHHSSKLARRANEVDSRGVTAITDGMRWEATLRADGNDVLFRQSKSNYSRPMPDELRLVRCEGGALRAATEAEATAKKETLEARDTERETAKNARRDESVNRAEAAIVAGLSKAVAPVTSKRALVALGSGANDVRRDAMERLLANGRVVARGDGKARRFDLAEGASHGQR